MENLNLNLSHTVNFYEEKKYIKTYVKQLEKAINSDFTQNFNQNRYESMQYRKSGNSGLYLPVISLGLWHNFGSVDSLDNQSDMLKTAFNLGITHFDLANNYGPLPGSAEMNFKIHYTKLFRHHRDELIISSKAGYQMWDGPYGGGWKSPDNSHTPNLPNGGSKKYLIASCEQSLKRTGLDYFDIFYSHRFSEDVPLEETIEALATIIKQGKALYAGISSYNAEQSYRANEIAKNYGIKLLIHQPNYAMFDRWVEDKPMGEDLLKTTSECGMGNIVFAPLSQGMLSNKYLSGIPSDSRAAKSTGHLTADSISKTRLEQIHALNEIAKNRNQTLSQLALSWVLRDSRVTSALIGASRPEQIIENVKCIENLTFSDDELHLINEILNKDAAWDNKWSPWHKR